MRPPLLQEVQRALVVRPDHVGDLVLSTPFLRALRAGLPEARLTALVAPAARGVVEGSSAVDRVVSELPREGFDLAVSLAPRTRSYRLVWRSGAPLRVGYAYTRRPLVRLGTRLWLTHCLTVDLEGCLERGEPVPHEVEQLGELARFLGLPWGETALELPVEEEDLAFGRSLAAGQLGLHLHANWLRAGWGPGDLAALARTLARRAEGVVVTYGPAEEAIAQGLRQALPSLSFAGGMSLKRWAAVLGACACVVSPDTGAVHVAAAMGTPVVVVYEAGTHRLCSQQWAPWGVPYRSLVKADPPRTIAEVVEALESLP